MSSQYPSYAPLTGIRYTWSAILLTAAAPDPNLNTTLSAITDPQCRRLSSFGRNIIIDTVETYFCRAFSCVFLPFVTVWRNGRKTCKTGMSVLDVEGRVGPGGVLYVLLDHLYVGSCYIVLTT